MGTQTIPPGGRLGRRALEVGEAVFFVWRGAGRALVNDDWRPVAPETLVYVGRGTPHDVVNDGPGDLALVWVATPPGLATLLAGLGRERAPGDPVPPPFDAPGDGRDLYRRARIAALEDTVAGAAAAEPARP
jgi:hypothetical protein